MFELFTDGGRRVIVLAQEESRLLVHDRIGTEHLLLGLLHVEDDETARALQHAGVTLAAARERVQQSQGRGKKDVSGHIPFTPRAKKVLELSLRVSQRLDGHTISGPHLLRAMLDVPDSTACQLLDAFGVDTGELARVADDLALASQGDAGPAGVEAPRHPSEPSAARAAWRGRRGLRRADYPSDSESSDRLVARIEELAIERDALASAIRRFARHDESCHPERGCSCGLQLVLDNLAPPSAQG